VVLDCREELHDDLDLLLDEDLNYVVVEADDGVVLELEHFDGLVRAAVEVVEPQDLLGLVRHVADLLIRHVAVKYSSLDVHEHILAVGLDDLFVVSLQIFLE